MHPNQDRSVDRETLDTQIEIDRVMNLSDMFCLKWTGFTNNMADTFKSLRGDNDFTDVTLACEDGTMLEAHKVILAASSPFFHNLLKVSKHHPHPLIYLKGVQMRQLSSVMDFLYQGEVNLNQEDLDSFLALAADLQLKVVDGMKTENLESGEVGADLIVKEEVENQAEVKPKAKNRVDRTTLVLYEMQNAEENRESGELADPERGVERQTEVKSKGKSAAERTRRWRERNKESAKAGLLKYLRKTAEKRRINSDFDKQFKDREARRKREWRKSAQKRSILSPETRMIM